MAGSPGRSPGRTRMVLSPSFNSSSSTPANDVPSSWSHGQPNPATGPGNAFPSATTLPGYYMALGWKPIEDVEYLGKMRTVMAFDFPGNLQGE